MIAENRQILSYMGTKLKQVRFKINLTICKYNTYFPEPEFKIFRAVMGKYVPFYFLI